MKTWTTNSGQVLEIKWMDSVHLCHSWRLTVRNGRENPYLRQELFTRCLYDHQLGETLLDRRETKEELCWLRALIDSDAPYDQIPEFHRDRARFIKRVLSESVPFSRRTIALATKYRLTR